MLDLIKNLPNKIKQILIESFKRAYKGEEKRKNIFLWWGGIAYAIVYFITNPIIKNSDFAIIDFLISIIVITYFMFHIFLIRKNSPKKPKLTKKQATDLKEKRKADRSKRIVRKLLLKEPLTQWRPGLVIGAVDLIIITTYIGYIV